MRRKMEAAVSWAEELLCELNIWEPEAVSSRLVVATQ